MIRYNNSKQKTPRNFCKTFSITYRSRNGNFFPGLIRRSAKGFSVAFPMFLFFSRNSRGSKKIRFGRDRLIHGLLHKFWLKIYEKIRVWRSERRQILVFALAKRIGTPNFLFFRQPWGPQFLSLKQCIM